MTSCVHRATQFNIVAIRCKGERSRELIEGRSCELLYPPSYSPDLNPIEEAFAKIKGLLRKSEARFREALSEAIGAAISAVTT